MGKFLFLLILIGLGYYFYQTGMFDSIQNKGLPCVGKVAPICGPIKGRGVPLCASPDKIALEIDSHIGSASDRLVGANNVARMLRDGDMVRVADRSKVKILENSKVKVQLVPYQIVKVLVLDGRSKSTKGWIERSNVIDTPWQELYQAMRATKEKEDGSAKNSASYGSGYSSAFDYEH